MGGCGGGAAGGGGGSRTLSAAGRVAQRSGSAPAMDPSPCQSPEHSSMFAFLQVAYHWWASLAAVCVRRPGDAHALWHRVVGVFRSMPVAGCLRVSGSVGRL